MGERGGRHLYEFAKNAPMGLYDFLGLLSVTTVYEYDVLSALMQHTPDGGRAAAQARIAEWQFNRDRESCGLSMKKRFKNYNPVVTIEIWVSDITTPVMNSSNGGLLGYSFLEHEEHHAELHEDNANKLDAAISPYIGECFCPACFAAIDAYLSALESFYELKDQHDNMEFDCADYPAGDNKAGACGYAVALANSLFSQWYTTLAPAWAAMMAACP